MVLKFTLPGENQTLALMGKFFREYLVEVKVEDAVEIVGTVAVDGAGEITRADEVKSDKPAWP